jgi:hypothetical protein
MPTLRSHTHLQAAQADTQAKACKRVCLPNRTGTLQTRHDSTSTERRAACKNVFASSGVNAKSNVFVSLMRSVSGTGPGFKIPARTQILTLSPMRLDEFLGQFEPLIMVLSADRLV